MREEETFFFQTTMGGDWTTVVRRRRAMADGRNFIPKYQQEPNMKTKNDGRKLGFSIFVDDLPSFYDNLLLRKLFRSLGKILDSYIPWRRRLKKETRYGFVCFEKEEDSLKAIRCLDGVVIFKHKISVTKSFDFSMKTRPSNYNHKDTTKYRVKEGLSFAEVVAMDKKVWIKKRAATNNSEKINNQNPAMAEAHNLQCQEVVEQLKEMKKTQESQSMMIQDLQLMLLALKTELDSWIGTKRVVNEENKEDGKKLEEDSFNSCSFIPDSIVQEHTKTTMEGRKNKEMTRGEEEQTNVEAGLSKEKEQYNSNTEDDISESISSGREKRSGFNKIGGGINKRRVSKNNRSSLRYNHIGSGFYSSRRKNIHNTKEKPSIQNEEEESSSRTVSLEMEKGKEHANKYNREEEKNRRLEAERIVETGLQVGVSFASNPSAAIDKLLEENFTI